MQGAYWLHEPGAGTEMAIVFSGSVAPEALAAFDMLADDIPGLGLLNVTSPALLHRGWSAQRAGRLNGQGVVQTCLIVALLGRLWPDAKLATVIDGSPAALAWLGGVKGMRVSLLGVDRFGQSGDLIDLYRTYRLEPMRLSRLWQTSCWITINGRFAASAL